MDELVGAGPGDPELMTLKGIRALEQADIVLYDALVSKEILDGLAHHQKLDANGRLHVSVLKVPHHEIGRAHV